LVEGAQMPKESELPQSLGALAYRNAATVDSGRDFSSHAERLIRSIDQVLEQKRKLAIDIARAAAVAADKVRSEPPAIQPPAPSVPTMPSAGRSAPPSDRATPALKVAMDSSGSASLLLRSDGLIRSPRDFWGGLALVLVAAFAIWASSDLPGM